MKPLQVWLPTSDNSLVDPTFQRDAVRAFDSWRGELTVWLLPELTEKVRWQLGPTHHVVGVPAEKLNRIDVYHIGQNGHVIGTLIERFRNSTVDGLLDAWLSARILDLYPAPETVRLSVPQIIRGRIKYDQVEFKPSPGPLMPITDLGVTGTFSAEWPPPSLSYRSVSPEGESKSAYGPMYRTDQGLTGIAKSPKTGTSALCSVVGWPEPLRDLIAPSSGLDVISAQSTMRRIAKLSLSNPTRALVEAREQARKFLSEGQTTREWQWFWPAIDQGGSQKVLLEAEDYKVFAKNWPALRDNPDFRRLLRQSVAIRRAWGPIGLFWALLIEKLENGERFQRCERCQRTIVGKKGKRFCDSVDNPDCFKQRTAERQRRCRARGIM